MTPKKVAAIDAVFDRVPGLPAVPEAAVVYVDRVREDRLPDLPPGTAVWRFGLDPAHATWLAVTPAMGYVVVTSSPEGGSANNTWPAIYRVQTAASRRMTPIDVVRRRLWAASARVQPNPSGLAAEACFLVLVKDWKFSVHLTTHGPGPGRRFDVRVTPGHALWDMSRHLVNTGDQPVEFADCLDDVLWDMGVRPAELPVPATA
jgi:hypothetical protein